MGALEPVATNLAERPLFRIVRLMEDAGVLCLAVVCVWFSLCVVTEISLR